MKPLSGRQDNFRMYLMVRVHLAAECDIVHMVHEVNGGLTFRSFPSFPGLPTIQFLIACSTAVLQVINTGRCEGLGMRLLLVMVI